MDDDQQFCLRWNNHQSTLVSVFDTLLEKGIHVDCTLAAEGQTLKAHKVVLSACSPYFESVLSQQYDKHPIIILKDVKYAELRAMMDYMYRGEVNISQDQLAALLKAAESLQIKGLSDNKPSRPPSRPAPPAAAHPPRAPSPPPQARDGSIDSREGSVSPTRRRKKARRLSTEGLEVPVLNLPPANDNATGNGDEAHCKEEAPRDGVEDLTIDEEADDQPAVTHNDVVRNFQWHMERSQDEIMNSSDGVRDSQGPKLATRQSIVTRSKKLIPEEPEKATTFAILKPVRKSAATTQAAAAAPPPAPAEAKEAKEAREAKEAKENKKQPPPKAPGKASPPKEPKEAKDKGKDGRYAYFPRERSKALPCAQYKTENNKYKCPNCQRCYNARKNLVRHVTLECGREPQYKCPHCVFSKHRRNELKKHLERKHPEHARVKSPPPDAPDDAPK
ncbi:longitudinals lacking protein, isoforms A/B/D/L-like isoform X2 [Hyposmocoma kahamanoa]|uniref:longitudinals lacking protein, isoforms A/B/D/L-like isoform X2 n=1 Tax=Hyposmocoma kahamanoa TaxID=1477025 RepID=UPI000E6D9D13|nr:longitudinals lacking protein, isoforms A/B/D/L-like isoform X2 [Hyposmocoma kahamanoa]